jgi:CheY-like chemotaxis protein
MRRSPVPESEDSTPLTVLIVDDDSDMRLYVRGCLRYLGENVDRVIEAGDGEKALFVLQTDVVHLVITDVVLPRLDGYGLCRAIKDDPLTRDVAVLVVSGEEKGPAAQATADGFLEKPFNAQQLREAVDKLPLRLPRPPPGAPVKPSQWHDE